MSDNIFTLCIDKDKWRAKEIRGHLYIPIDLCIDFMDYCHSVGVGVLGADGVILNGVTGINILTLEIFNASNAYKNLKKNSASGLDLDMYFKEVKNGFQSFCREVKEDNSVTHLDFVLFNSHDQKVVVREAMAE